MVASFTEYRFSKSRLILTKLSRTELFLKRRNASPFTKPFLQFKGWQDEKCVY